MLQDKDDEKEAEFILYCTERFHEVYGHIFISDYDSKILFIIQQLFDSEQYEEAALLVATSPMV